MSSTVKSERVQTVVIGGGQAGLSVGYHLAERGISFVILESNPRIGDSWRTRWDSLRLFTPARFDAIPGLPFPAPADEFPTKDQMADYLESYAKHFDLPVRTGVTVTNVARNGDRYTVRAGSRSYDADHVVVAMSDFQKPRIPAFASELDSSIMQLHSREYLRPSQLRAGATLLVGAGNSGAEIALESARSGHTTWMSGRDTGSVPFRLGGLAGRLLLTRFVLRFVFHRVLTTGTPFGRKARPSIVSKGSPLIRVKGRDLAAASVERVPRCVGAREGKPLLDDGRVLDVANVVWCTGFHPGFSWIELPVFGEHGEPVHDRGVVASEPGLYFVGLHFLYAMSSTMIHGVGRDAEHIANVVAGRVRAHAKAQPRQQALTAAVTT
ncbi:MAG TPA: FAD-dependent oxidoreductase [Gemmatimonadaceae bacterium]|jgi:putative flavoprotein involved in K+ transport